VSENPGALYHSMHSYLAGSAVDGVKVDCQVGQHSPVFEPGHEPQKPGFPAALLCCRCQATAVHTNMQIVSVRTEALVDGCCCRNVCVLQAGAGLVGSCLGSGPGAAQRFQMALEDSIARHFPGNHAINCMCHSSENFYRCAAHTAGLAPPQHSSLDN
jgi:hypothetical protein